MDSESAFRAIIDMLRDFQNFVASRFDRVEAKLAEHDKTFELVGGRLGVIDGRLGVIDGRLEGLEFHYGSLDRRVGRIETRLEDVERRLPA